jgi:hypothetical protein
VTIFARSQLAPMARRSIVRLVLVSGLVACLTALLSAAPAHAVVSSVEPHAGEVTTVGLQPRDVSTVLDGGLSAGFGNPNGNPVLHGSDLYVIYWDPDDYYFSEWQSLIDTFLQGVGAESGTRNGVFSVLADYTDKSNQTAGYKTTLKYMYVDDAPYPATENCTDPEALTIGAVTCLTDKQIQAQLKTFIAEHDLPTGMGPIFDVLTPPGVTVCLDGGGPTGHCSDFVETVKKVEEEEATKRTKESKSESFTPGEPLKTFDNSFCSYHSDINPDGLSTGDAKTILYGVIPWTAGGLGSLSWSPRLQGYDCQDGGFDPSSKPIEQREHARERTEKEKETEREATAEEKAKDKKVEELEGPHEEEPNQLNGTGFDGAYDTGLADLIIGQIAVEQQNIITDPLLNAWQGSKGYEATDECRNFFAGGEAAGGVTANEATGAGTLSNQHIGAHNYYLNLAFNFGAERFRSGVPCIGGVTLQPRFTSPNPVYNEEPVGFNGMESLVSLAANVKYATNGTPEWNYATYRWNFGDGSGEVAGYAPGAPPCEEPWLSPCAGSVFHEYQYGGTYNVTLTITDTGGNVEKVEHPITVIGPPAPTPPSENPGGGSSPGASAPGAGASGQGSSGAGSSSGSPAGVPAPVAAALIPPQSLRTALHKGLVVSYSVNEQVAGRFEVLLSRSVARRLGISGTPATGLPAGSPPELVIAKAVLVTTKGGRSSVHIHFSKRTAARLAHAHQVSLMLRLIVRNAATSNPLTTTVVSTTTLTG